MCVNGSSRATLALPRTHGGLAWSDPRLHIMAARAKWIALRQHSRLLGPDHCRRLWEMPCLLHLAMQAVYMEPGSCTHLRAVVQK